MLAMPVSQIGWRASRNTSSRSNFVPWLALLAPRRWHTDDVAVHKLAATANRIALSIWPSRGLLACGARVIYPAGYWSTANVQLQQRDRQVSFRSDVDVNPVASAAPYRHRQLCRYFL